MVGREDTDRGVGGDRGWAPGGDPGELRAEVFEAAERARGLGELVVAGARRSHRGRVEGLDAAGRARERAPVGGRGALQRVGEAPVGRGERGAGGVGRGPVGVEVPDVEGPVRSGIEAVERDEQRRGIGFRGSGIDGGDDDLEVVQTRGFEQTTDVGFPHDRGVGDRGETQRGGQRVEGLGDAGAGLGGQIADRRARRGLVDEGPADVEEHDVDVMGQRGGHGVEHGFHLSRARRSSSSPAGSGTAMRTPPGRPNVAVSRTRTRWRARCSRRPDASRART